MAGEDTPLTAVIINFRTPDLTRRAVQTFRSFYPSIPLLLIDNGSGQSDARELGSLQRESSYCTELLLNRRNLHHGPAMHQALEHLHSHFVLFLDSDCVVLRGGFLEAMIALIEHDPHGYAAGKRITMNRRGFDLPEGSIGHPYLRPICLLVRRDLYLTLPPFERHGAPCLRNMIAASQRGYALLHFPVEEYILHEGRGTAYRHGYRLGWRGKVNHFLNRIGL